MSDDIKPDLKKFKKKKKLAVPEEFLDNAKSYEDKQMLVRVLTEREKRKSSTDNEVPAGRCGKIKKPKMKQLLEMLPKILGMMPEIVKYIKYIPIIMGLAGIGYSVYYVTKNYKDPYMCYENEIYEQISVTSSVYKFKGGYCISDK